MQKLKKFIRHFFSINDTPHHIAGGAALGFFLGIIPGEGVLATIVLTSLFRLNRVAGLAGVVATNMWTTALVLPLAAATGGFIFGKSPEALAAQFEQNYALGWHYLIAKALLLNVALPLMIGYIVIAGVLSGFFYGTLFFLLVRRKIAIR